MNHFKKVFKPAIPVMIAGTLLFGCALSSAADTPIVDIKTDTVVSGTVKSTKELHMYKFIAPEDGYFNLIFKSKASKEDYDDFRIEIFKGDVNTPVKSYRGGSFDSQPIGAKKGVSFFVGIEMPLLDTGSANFDINVKFTKADDWENEINDTQATAREISVNKEYNGSADGTSFLGAGEADRDMFVFTAPERGYFTVDLKHADVAEHGRYSMEVLDENANKVFDGSSDEFFNSPKLSAAKGQKFYICVDNSMDAVHQIYKLKVTHTATDAFELEDNALATNATPIDLGKEYTGVHGNFPMKNNYSDYDCYKFTLGDYSKVTFDISNIDITDKEEFQVTLFNQAGDDYKLTEDKVTDKVTVELGKGTYVLRMDYLSSHDVDYKLKVSAAPVKKKLTVKSANIKKLSGKKYSLDKVVINKKDSKAVSYSVSISDNKNMKKSKSGEFTGKKTLTSKKALKIKSSKKTFYVTVSPCYKDVFGKTIKGTASKVKAVNI